MNKTITISVKKTALSVEQIKTDFVQNLLDTFLSYWYTLDMKEWSAFNAFAASPMHKKNQHSVSLVERIKEALRKDTTELRGEDLILRYTSAKASDAMPIKMQALANEFQTLIDLIKKYLAYKQLMENPLDFQRMLTKSLKQRNNNELFQQNVKCFEQKLSEMPLTIMVASDQWWLAHQSYYHQHTEQISNPHVFQENLKAYDQLHLLTLLRNYLEYLNRNQRTVERDDFELEKKIKFILHQSKPSNVLAQLYHLVISLFKSSDEDQSKHYHQFKETYPRVNLQIAKADRLVLVKTVINYLSILHYQYGGQTWLFEVFYWMQRLNKEELYEFEGSISDDEYLNFSLTALAIGDLRAFKQFEIKYSTLLDPKIKAHVLGLCKAYFLEKEHKVDEALALLNQYFPLGSKEELKYNLRAKELRVMLCYEIDDADMPNILYNLFKFCQRLIEKELMTALAVAPHFNFYEVVKNLDRYKNPDPDKKVQQQEQALKEIKQRIQAEEQIANRSWIERKLAVIV